MEKAKYLKKYFFDWELFDVILAGRSTLDSKFFISSLSNNEQTEDFLKGYGLDPNDPVSKAELFGIFQEALQFIKRYFLKEGNPDGLDVKVPSSLYSITEITELFYMGNMSNHNVEERIWVEIVLKVMHTILHVDKDLRSSYFPVIQTQIFDRFYKYIYRDENNKLFLGSKECYDRVQLVDFQTKAKKTRDSVIIKLLHKTDNVAEELFDRVGVRFITENIFNVMRVINFLVKYNIVIPHNIKPSRSINRLIDLKKFRNKHRNLVKIALRNKLAEERFLQAVNREANECLVDEVGDSRNIYSLKMYQSIQFTGTHLITYKNPFVKEFNKVRQFAKELGQDNEITRKILSLDTSTIARDVRFFYPFEVQVVDKKSHKQNTIGEASHNEYKKVKLKVAMKRVFWALLKNKNIDLE